MFLPLVTWLTGIYSRALLLPAVHPWRVPCRRVSGDGMRVEPSLMHHEGGSWTSVRTHTPIKFSKVLTEPLAPLPLDRSKFRENGSQLSPNRTCRFPCIRLSIRKLIAGALWIDGTFDTAFPGLVYGVMSDLSCGALGADYSFQRVHISDM